MDLTTYSLETDRSQPDVPWICPLECGGVLGVRRVEHGDLRCKICHAVFAQVGGRWLVTERPSPVLSWTRPDGATPIDLRLKMLFDG